MLPYSVEYVSKLMKIFCTGLSRMGTTSLCSGLELLGIKAFHFPFAFFGQPEKIGAKKFNPCLKRSLIKKWKLWKELKALRCHDPLAILSAYDAFADLPVPLYFKELDLLFPQAKFIHTTRPLDDWLRSMKWLFERGRRERNWTGGELADEMHYSIYGCTQYNEEALIAAYERYELLVKHHFVKRPEKLLILDLSKGELDFRRIAPFLGKTNPDIPFPSKNKMSLGTLYSNE